MSLWMKHGQQLCLAHQGTALGGVRERRRDFLMVGGVMEKNGLSSSVLGMVELVERDRSGRDHRRRSWRLTGEVV